MTEEHRRMPSFADEDLIGLRSAEDSETEQIELAAHETSLDFLRKIYRSTRQPMARRMRAAQFALQHEHPKLGAMAVGSISGQDFATLLERAIRASGKEREVKQIEGRAEPTD